MSETNEAAESDLDRAERREIQDAELSNDRAYSDGTINRIRSKYDALRAEAKVVG